MGMDKAGEFYRKIFGGLLAYVSNRIPEISEEYYKIDDALKAGFGWELGPFESWDLFGYDQGLKFINDANKKMGASIETMRSNGMTSFYKTENGKRMYFDTTSNSYIVIPGTEELIDLNSLRDENKVWGNSDCTLVHVGDGILNLEFHTKMNTIGGGVLQGINKAIDLAENEYKGLVISNYVPYKKYARVFFFFQKNKIFESTT